jgi:pyridoxine kinase
VRLSSITYLTSNLHILNSCNGGCWSSLRCSRRNTCIPRNAPPRNYHSAQLVRSRVSLKLLVYHRTLSILYRTLTQVPLNDLPSLQRALKILHEEYRVPNVVLSSIPLKPWLFHALPSSIRPVDDAEHLLCISSSSTSPSSTPTVHAQCVPLLPGYFSGVGDLFSALLLAHFHPGIQLGSECATPVSYAASQALAKTHAVLRITHEYSEALPEQERQLTDDEKDMIEPLRKTRRMRGRELRLIQGQDIIRGVQATDVRRLQHWTGFWK